MSRSNGRTPLRTRAARWAWISELFGERVTYLLAGGVTAVVYYVLLGGGLLAAQDRVPYLFLVVGSHFVTALIVYPMYRLAIFKVSGEDWLPGFMRFYAVGLGFLAASVIGLPIMVEFGGIPLMVAQALIILMSPPLSYAINRTWTFRKRGDA
ncbi:GtrA family protein [Actinoallomurus sp. NPDC052308]|uniref:GtrA family protein n=1 Tax=Actinoallomurus sp. NPDC052308 TaxID=3155530 RepID=UPI003417F70D